jgi:ketosteroid isomerase-like protein
MAAHQQMQICCTSELEEVVVIGEVAYTRSRDALSVTRLAGHRMTVYRKQRDGRWLLSRDVHTLSGAA